MEYLQAFPVAIIDEDYDGKNAAGRGMRRLAEAIEKEGFRVVAGLSYSDAGRLVNVASLEQLHEIRMHRVEIEFAGEVPEEAVRKTEGVDSVTVEGRRVHCVVRGSFEPLMATIAGAHVVNLTSHEPSLEDTFLEYYSGVGKEAVGASC